MRNRISFYVDRRLFELKTIEKSRKNRNRKSKKQKIKEREKKGREKEMGVKGNSP